MTDQNEQKTLQDLFRVINDMRGEASTRHDEVKSELKAIRDVVDNELASQGQVDALEGHLKDVQRTLRQHGKKLDDLERSKQPI